MDPILEVGDRKDFFIGVGFYQLVVDPLFELPEGFIGMFKQLLDVRIIGGLPFGVPFQVKGLNGRIDVSVNVLEVKGVGSVGGNILKVAVYDVLGLTSIGQVMTEVVDIEHGV